MASLKEVKMRIASVESTKKITQARQMISSSHLHRAQVLLTSATAYSRALESLLATLCDADAPLIFPLTAQRQEGAVALVAVASNSSMCGAFNARMEKEMLAVAQQHAGQELLIFPIGKKLRKPLVEAGYTPQGEYDNLSGKAAYEEAVQLVDELVKRFTAGELQRVILLHYHYRNMAMQNIVTHELLPYALPAVCGTKTTTLSADGYILEPSREALCSDLMLQALKAKFYAALMDTHTSEHGARTMAMQLASENADEMLDELHLSYNKLRQQNITSELLDIIGGQFA